MPSITIHMTLLFMMDPNNVTSMACSDANKMPIPLLPFHLGEANFCILALPLGSIRSSNLGINLLLRCSSFTPLSLSS